MKIDKNDAMKLSIELEHAAKAALIVYYTYDTDQTDFRSRLLKGDLVRIRDILNNMDLDEPQK